MAVASDSSTRGLTRREKATLRANWSEIAEHVSPPGIAWRWAESGVSEGLKHYLRHHGLIRRHDSVPDAWETTERLWMWIIETAGDDEVIGVRASGQETLPGVDSAQQPSEPRRSEVLGTTPPRRRGSGVQVTLTGERIGVVNGAGDSGSGVVPIEGTKIESNLSKDSTKPIAKEKAARDPGQTRLTLWPKWFQWTHHQCACRLDRATGGVYPGCEPV